MDTGDAAKKDSAQSSDKSGGDTPVTKDEMKNEMRTMILELLQLGMINPKPHELKLELMPNDVKLEGSKNYLSWARRVKVLLGGKRVEHFLAEDCVEPANKLSPEWKVWHTTNFTIVAWLLASMSPSVSKMVEAMTTAAQIWKTLSNMYSKRGNVMVMMEIQNKADAVKQAGRSVEQYASELQYLWGELDHYAPLHMRDPQDAQEVQKWVEDRRVTHFLRNLDPEFESRRAAFCHQDSLPTMEEAVSAMVIEESRLRMMSGDNPVKSAYTTVSERVCYNCGEKGHLSYNCPLPKSYGGRSGTRGGRGCGHGEQGGSRGGRGGRVGGRGRGRGGPQINAATTEEVPSVTLTGEQVKQWEQWQKSQASETSNTTPAGPMIATTSHFGNFANYAHLGKGTQAQALASTCRHNI
jgi:uncharacterized membrane protein YgcG